MGTPIIGGKRLGLIALFPKTKRPPSRPINPRITISTITSGRDKTGAALSIRPAKR